MLRPRQLVVAAREVGIEQRGAEIGLVPVVLLQILVELGRLVTPIVPRYLKLGLQKILPISSTSRDSSSTRKMWLALLVLVLLVLTAVVVLLDGVDEIHGVVDGAPGGCLVIFSIFVGVVVKILDVPLLDRVDRDRLC